MQARAAPMPVVRGDRAEAYSLAHDSEVVAGAAVGEAGAAIRHEERGRRCPKQPVPFPGIGRQLGGRAVGEWQEAGLAELAPAKCQDTGVQIDIGSIEGERLADPEAGDGEESE